MQIPEHTLHDSSLLFLRGHAASGDADNSLSVAQIRATAGGRGYTRTIQHHAVSC